MRNEKREQWKSQVERKLSKWKGRTKAGWTEIYYAAAAGKEDWGIRQAAVFNLMWPHVRFVLWSHICVRSSENLYSEVFNNYGMSENLGAMHNAHASALIHSCSLFTDQPQNLSIFLSSCSSQSTACRFSVSDFQVILLPELLHNGCAEKSSVPPLSQRNTVYQSSSKG